MRYQELEEYQTKNKQEIEIRIEVDSEGDNNRGWIVHKLDAYVNNERVGYLKISYIPKKRFDRYYKNILDYASIIGGGHLNDNPSDIEIIKYLSSVKMIDSKYYYNDSNPESDKAQKALIKRGIKNLRKYKGKAFSNFRNFHLDKPLVDYIKVYSGDWEHQKDDVKPTDVNWQRQGIATALYKKAATWLWDKYGLYLWASGLQAPEAAAAWQKMSKDGHVVKVGKRYHIDPTRL